MYYAYCKMIELIESYKKSNDKNTLFEILDRINTPSMLDYIIDDILDNSNIKYKKDDFQKQRLILELKEFLNPSLLVKIALEKTNINNFQDMLIFIPKKINNDFINYYETKTKLFEIINKINDMTKELNDFANFNSFESLVLKAKNIFNDQTKSLKIEKENLENQLIELKSQLNNNLNSLSIVEFLDLNYKKIDPFTGKGGNPPLYAFERIKKEESKELYKRTFSYFNDEKLMEEYSKKNELLIDDIDSI